MEPITLATSFATIVSLLPIFQSAKTDADLKGFIQWLHDIQAENLANLLEDNEKMQDDLSELMNKNHDEVMSQLQTLNDLTVSIASHMSGLKSLALQFENTENLSDQAIDVLRQFVKSGGNTILVAKVTSGRDFDKYIVKGGKNISYNEPLFIEDDMKALVKRHLVIDESTSPKKPKYKLTRHAVAYVEAMDSK